MLRFKLPSLPKEPVVRTVQLEIGAMRFVEVSRWNVLLLPALLVPVMTMLPPLMLILLIVGGVVTGGGTAVMLRSTVKLAWSSTKVAVTPAGSAPRTRFGNGSMPV